MAKIAEVVKLRSGYANFVELRIAFAEAQENSERMAMYRPTKAHRQALERICRGLYQPTDKKFYLLSGSYGTGKSHLCLMAANLLSKSSAAPEISGFYQNYSKLDPEFAQRLKNIRKDGQYLVALCDYNSGRRFEDVVLKAVFEACAGRGLDTEFQTEFDEAERQLQDWEKMGASGMRNFYDDFVKALGQVAPAVSEGQLRANLKSFDSEALKQFRSSFKLMMGGIEFQAKSGNLIPIILRLVKSNAFKEKFNGLAIFFDEFGFTLEKGAYSKDLLQGFMETVCKNEPNVMFVGCIHKSFTSYADRFSKDDAAVMSARLTQVDLLNEGIEEIIGAIVETDKKCEAWTKEVEPKTGVFDQLVPHCKTLRLFPWIEDLDRIRQRVLEDIYGVHPMALACLLRLSSEIGSNARSTFTFFSGDNEGAYADFINSSELTASGGKLNLYAVDRLFKFFENEFSTKNSEITDRKRQFVNGFQSSVDQLWKFMQAQGRMFTPDNKGLKILKVILIYSLCQVPTTAENIQFGLYAISPAEKKPVENSLKEMHKGGVVFLRPQSKTYELAVGTGEDPMDLIDQYMADTSKHPSDTAAEFLREAGAKLDLDFMEAKNFNLPFSDDKRLGTRFVQAKDLGEPLWDRLRADWEQSRGKPGAGCEGTAVYALCEDEAEIELARRAADTITDPNLIVAIPYAPQPFTETLLRVKACRWYLPPSQAQNITAQTESRLRDLLENATDGYLTQLQRTLSSILEGDTACWYATAGKILVDGPKQPHKPADMLCESLFTKRCRVKHADLNFRHDEKWRTGKNTALKQAVENLLTTEQVMIDNGNPDNHGEKRYLEKVLLKGAGALKKIETKGTVSFFACEKEPGKIGADFPMLKEMCARLAALNPGESFSVGHFIREAMGAPWGVGGTPLLLALAHVLRAWGERLIVYKDSTKMIEQSVGSYDDLVKIVSDPGCKVVFEIRNISPSQNKLIDLIAKGVQAPPLKHGETRTLASAFEAIFTWWNGLPEVAKIPSLYEKERQGRLSQMKNLLRAGGKNSDRFDFLLKQLPAIFNGGPASAALTDKEAENLADDFAADVKLLSSGEDIVRRRIAGKVCEVFGTDGDMVECEKAMNRWYTELTPAQRDPSKYDDEASMLLSRLEKSAPFETKLMQSIPKDFGFGSVNNWSSLHEDDLAAKMKQAKSEIEKEKIFVQKPDLEKTSYIVHLDAPLWVHVPKGGAKIIYTTDGSDPAKSESAKTSEGDLDLAGLLGDKPKITVKMCSRDEAGNASDIASVELVNKAREYEIQLKMNPHGGRDATFKCPEDAKGLVAVLESLLNYGTKSNLISVDSAQNLKSAFSKLVGEK